MKTLHSCRLITTILLCGMVVVFWTVSAHAQDGRKGLVSFLRVQCLSQSLTWQGITGDQNPNSNITVSATDSDTGFRKFLNREIDLSHVLPHP